MADLGFGLPKRVWSGRRLCGLVRLRARSPGTSDQSKPQSISGVVLDPAGKPVTGAAVVVGIEMRSTQRVPGSPRSVRHILESDTNGRFECPAPDGDAVACLYAYKDGFAPAAVLFSYPKSSGRPPELRLSKPQPFAAKLIDGDGNAIANADARITVLAVGPFESDGGARVGIGYEHIRWEFIRASNSSPSTPRRPMAMVALFSRRFAKAAECSWT